MSDAMRQARFTLRADPAMPAQPMRNLFRLRLGDVEHSFGLAGAALWRFLGVYFYPLPPEGDPAAQRRWINHHFVDPARPYLPEPAVDVRSLFRRWSRLLGRPAIVVARERRVELEQVTGLQGAFVAYLARTVVSPDEERCRTLAASRAPRTGAERRGRSEP